jgi:hypothetical protein
LNKSEGEGRRDQTKMAAHRRLLVSARRHSDRRVLADRELPDGMILAARLTSRIAMTSACETADGTILCVAEILVDLGDVPLVRLNKYFEFKGVWHAWMVSSGDVGRYCFGFPDLGGFGS